MIEELDKICKTIENADLTKYNTYRLNSFCDVLVFVKSVDELASVLDIIKKYKVKYFVIGNGSNIIIPEHYDGVIIKLELKDYKIEDDIVEVESGYMINKLAIELINQGYGGLDFACGIPGTIGGSIYGNAGCYGSSISEVLISAKVFNGNKIIELSNEELEFGYRTSIIKKSKKKYVILSAKFKLTKTNKDELMQTFKERTEKRIASQDLEHPSCGSVFRNPENVSAWKLISDAGLKGYTIGGASISNKHANFIINSNKATYTDVVKLIKYIQKQIKKIYNIDLVLEQQIIK